MSWMRNPPRLYSLALCFVVCLGCTRSVRPGSRTPVPAAADADADPQSERDGRQLGAVPMILGSDEDEELALDIFESDGEVSWPARKHTRWRLAGVSSKPMDANTPLRCELRYKPEIAQLQVDAWSEAQQPLPEHHQSAPGIYVSEVFLPEPAPVYLRVRALRPEDTAHFTLRCTWQRFVSPDEGSRGGRGRYRPHPRPLPDPDERLNRATEGRITRMYREGPRFVLRIDKGEMAGVRVGHEGVILAGRSGREPLDNGSFKVVKVFANDCVAESPVRSVGTNFRVLLFVR